MASSHWLVKSEPFKYSWDQFKSDKKAVWDGVRNFEARNNLRAMKKGDLVLFYHSSEGKEVVGIATVAKEAYPDPPRPKEIGPQSKSRPRRRSLPPSRSPP